MRTASEDVKRAAPDKKDTDVCKPTARIGGRVSVGPFTDGNLTIGGERRATTYGT